ncbi:hypothetical protein BDQ17DRAFT_1275458 [Cyathus striatus]|nr:hypothetical protein BDQ17DRAFT_1275458 [Cyathus striatus]
MSAISQVLAKLTPPPFVNPDQYDGWQIKWKFFVFRPAMLTREAFLLLALLFYVAFTYLGKSANAKKANKWRARRSFPLYSQQFSKPAAKGGLTSDGYSDFFAFSTGRRNIASLHTIFTLRPRHDLFQYLFQTARTLVDLQYRPKDDIQLDFKLAPGTLSHDFVWAIVAKEELLSVKEGRWDLTFTKTSENPALPPTLSVMSEFADVTDNLLKPAGNFSLIAAIQDPKVLPYFRSLSITDQPRDRPAGPLASEDRSKHVILSLAAPSPSHAADTLAIVTAVFQLIDNLHKLNLRPETKNKLKKTRDDLDKTLKEDSEKSKKEEAVEDKKSAKRRAEEERIAKLSPAEQRKASALFFSIFFPCLLCSLDLTHLWFQ